MFWVYSDTLIPLVLLWVLMKIIFWWSNIEVTNRTWN